jgi:ATP-binding cassette subfamily B protein
MNIRATAEADTASSFQPEGTAEPSGLACLVIVARHHGLDLSVSQLIHDNLLSNQEVSVPELIKAAGSAGLKALPMRLSWHALTHLKNALPVIVRLKNGRSMVLTFVDGEADPPRVVLRDPLAGEDALLYLDRVRFEAAWTGEVLLVKRNYDVRDESQPFSIGFIRAMLLRERWIVRDIVICAVVLGFLSVMPIVFWQVLTGRVLYYKAFNTFYVLCLAMLVFIAFETSFLYVRRYLIIHLASRFEVRLNTYLFDKILRLPIDFFERNQIGMIMTVYGYHSKILSFLTGSLLGSLLDSSLLMFFLPLMFYLSPLVTTVILFICGIILAWLLITLPILRRKNLELEAASSARGSFFYQTLAGIRTVKSLALETRHRNRFDVLTAQVAAGRVRFDSFANLITTVVHPLQMLAVTGGLALAVYICMVTNDPTLTAGLFAFILLSQRVVAPLVQIAMSINQWDDARVGISAIAEVVNRPEEEGRTGRGARNQIQGRIQFSNVTFSYRDTSSPALRDVAFVINPGTSLGIVGRSGSGKTTITRLMQRLHANYEGMIKIDSLDIREYDLDYIRRSLGVVLQENFLFTGSIRENIAAAKPDATFDDIVRAARLAGAEEFIDRLPRGYETFIYEGSSNLSGGQRQRIAIARALIVDPRIMILDEATSALDPESEAIVNANLARIAHGRTLIVVSHRLSSLVKSDAILVLERGRVEDLGKHDELLGRCEIYRHLWDQQNRHLTAPPQIGPGKPPFRSPSLVT